MRKAILSLATIGAAMLMTLTAHSYQEEAVIRMGKQEFRGKGNVIGLKQQLRAAGYHVQGKEITSVTVKAISKVGPRSGQYGHISLSVAGQSTYAQTVYGDDYAYRNPLKRDMQSVTLYAPRTRRAQADGKWQLLVRGPMKIGKIKVTMETRSRRGGGHDRGTYTQFLSCSSYRPLSVTCSVGANSRIISAHVRQLLTRKHSCVKNIDWYISGNSIVVMNGCKAQFQLQVSDRYSRPGDRGCYTDRYGRTICDGVVVDRDRRDRDRNCRVNRRGERVCDRDDRRDDRTRDCRVNRRGERVCNDSGRTDRDRRRDDRTDRDCRTNRRGERVCRDRRRGN